MDINAKMGSFMLMKDILSAKEDNVNV